MRIYLSFLLALICCSLAPVQAQIVSYNGSYSQDFDTLPTANGDLNLDGWYSSDTTLVATSGGSTGSAMSLGATGSTERALGSNASDSTGDIYYGVRMVNNTGSAIFSLDISYYGETWRQGAANSADPYGLNFAYSRDATALLTGTYFNYSQLNYVSSVPVVVGNPATSGMASAINGNASGNRSLVSASLPLGGGWQPGQELWLRWTDQNSNGFDSTVGIDNLTISSVPEPSSALLLATAALGWGLKRRRVVLL